jgi:hypothetical protein
MCTSYYKRWCCGCTEWQDEEEKDCKWWKKAAKRIQDGLALDWDDDCPVLQLYLLRCEDIEVKIYKEQGRRCDDCLEKDAEAALDQA